MDKHQELKTNLVLEAQSALSAVKELSDGLDKIAKLKFENVKQGFDSLTKAFEAAQKMSSKVAKVQTEDEKKLQNLLQERKKLISDMMEQFSRQKSGLTVKVDMSAAQKELQRTTRMVADMYDALGQTGKAKALMGEALNVLTKLSNGGMKGIGLEQAKREYKDFERQLQNNKNLQKELDRQVANGIAEQHRQQALKEGKDPQSDPVYAKSEVGKKAKKAAEEAIRAEKERQELQKHLSKMQAQPSTTDSLNKMLGVNENVINSPDNKKRRKKQEEKARRLSESTEDNLREKNLRYEQKVRYDLAKKQAQEEERQQREALRNEQRMAAEREKALRYEQRVRSAIAKAEYQESQRQARLEERQAQNLHKLQDRIADFQRKVDFEKRPDNVMSEKGLFALEQELIKIKRMADGIGATDISAKLTRGMLEGISVVSKAQKEKDKAARQADKEQEKRLKAQKKVLDDIAKLYKDIQQHKGVNGKGYSQTGYIGAMNKIENLRNRAYDVGLKGDAALLNPSLLQGVNTKVSQFNTRLSEAKDKAQELYMRFRETRRETDRLNFLKAKNDLRELENLAEDFNKAISKASRHDLTIGNIAKRAREHFNWTAGAFVENQIIEFPRNLVSDVSKYELAMAGVAQVLPKAEESQAAMNEQFRGFAETAAKYGQNVEGVIEAAKSIGRMYGQGDGNAEVGALNTQILAQQAAKMATVDNFDMMEATRGLESALSQFNLQTEDSNLLMQRSGHILDVWTKLAHSSGASAQDLTQGVSKAGAAAKNAGVSFEMLNSLIAVGVRSTAENGNIIGNSLKSMFSSILSDKNIKNMEQFGIQIYRIGKKGTKELRPMQDIILDISKALSENPKNVDTKGLREFMMPISGGKQQYSRVMAILGNYKELKRTMNLADDANGFTNKQLEIQLGTISRKFETLKANITNLFVNTGADGLANDLKWILDCLNRLTHALANSDSHFYKWAKYGTMALIAWKAIPAFINMATKAVARFNVAKAAGNASDAVSAGLFGGISANYQAELDRQKKKRLKKSGVDTSKMDAAEVAAAFGQLAATTGKIDLRIGSLGNKARSATGSIKNLGKSVAGIIPSFLSWVVNLGKTARSLGALGSIGRVVAGVFGVVRGALNLLGGPMGWVISILIALGGHLVSMSVDADLAADKMRELSEEVDNLTVEVGNQLEEIEENRKKAKELAEQYNALTDELNALKEADDGSAESAQRQNELMKQRGEISNEIQSILHANALEFDEDGKINMETVDQLADAERQSTDEKIQQTMDKLNMEQAATKAAIESTKARMEALKAEINTTTLASAAYRGLYNVITFVKAAMVEWNRWAVSLLSGGFTGWLMEQAVGKHVVDSWKQSFQGAADEGMKEVRYRLAETADPTNLKNRHEYRELEEQLAKLEKTSQEYSDAYNSAYAVQHGLGYSREKHEFYDKPKINPTKDNPNEGTTATEPQEKGKKGRKGSSGAGGAGHHKKTDYLFSDEESQAFSKGSKHINQAYSDKGVEVPVLQAIAKALNGGSFAGVADPFHNGAKNVWDSTYNFAEQLKTQFQSGESLYTALDNIFQGWGIAWKNVIDTDAKALQDKYNYKKMDKYFKDPTEGDISPVGAGDLNAALQKGVDTWLGATMDLHGVGCVEAVEKIGSYYSKFLCDEFNKGVRYIPTLMEDAAQAGIQTLAYDESQLEIGDCIVWANSGDTQNHIGIYKGNGMAVDNSSGADRIVERAVNRSWQRNEYIIKTGKGAGGGKVSRWQDGGDGLSGFALNPVTELLGHVEEEEERFKNTKKRLEIEEELTGDTAGIAAALTKNMENMLENSEDVAEMWEQYKKGAEDSINDYLDKHPAVAAKAGGKKNFFNISDTAKEELAKAAKDKEFEKAVKNFITAKKNFEKSTSELKQSNLDVRRMHGFLNDNEKYNRRMEHNEHRSTMSEDPSERIGIARENYRLALAEMARLDKQYTDAVINNREKIADIEKDIAKKEEERKEVSALYDKAAAEIQEKDAKKRAAELERIVKAKEEALRRVDNDLKKKREELSDRQNGDKAVQDALDAKEKQEEVVKSLKRTMEDLEQAVQRAGANVSTEFFDKLLLQGKSLRDCLKDIVDEIAKIALKNLMYSAFHVRKTPLEEQGDIGVLLGAIGRKKKGSPAVGAANVASMAARAAAPVNRFSPFVMPRNQWGWPGAQQSFSLLQQPLQQATQGMTALSTGLTTTNATMGAINATNQVLNTTTGLLNTTQIVGRTATTLDTAAKHTNKASLDRNTMAVERAATSYQSAGVTRSGGSGSGWAFGVSSIFGLFANGGKVPAYATGGYTNGLIRGAGTGTSDSILTYLAHRGQFIQTSNGEYIVKKSSVDRLGVGFLDMLNNNPDSIRALNGLKRYATGGNLGDSYAPSMSIKGVDAYKTFNKANMEKQQHFSTRKMEGLLQGLRDDVQDGNRNSGTVTQPVILNTQADSASVMKAIAKNPRALQAILGKQQKRGFR